ISDLQLEGRILVVTNGRDEKVEKSARNIPWVKVLSTEGINVFDLMKYENLLLSQDGVGKIEEALGK
ncbi:MAG TPA: 50S ribosomal protein L4, partial [Deltaproteobacteria bacterium]|nr:50S ribosomal protein L4 [Deltaproteobacteria bacterium]